MGIRSRLDTLISQHGDKLHAFVNNLSKTRLGTGPEASEIVNTAVLCVLRFQEKFEHCSEMDLLRFLYWKTKCLAIDEHRRGRRSQIKERSFAILSNDDCERKESAQSPTVLLHRKSKNDTALELVGQVQDPECRTAIELVFVHGIKPQSAAIAMKKSDAEMHNLLRRGFRNLSRIAKSSNAAAFLTSGITN